MKKALFFVALVAAFACRKVQPDSHEKSPPKPKVLAPEVGKVLEEVVRSDRVRAALPHGWTIESVQIQARSIIVKLSGPDGSGATLTLLPPGEAPEQGKWFSYSVPPNPPGLKALAQAIDEGFHSDPWSEPKYEGIKPPENMEPGGEKPSPQGPQSNEGKSSVHLVLASAALQGFGLLTVIAALLYDEAKRG